MPQIRIQYTNSLAPAFVADFPSFAHLTKYYLIKSGTKRLREYIWNSTEEPIEDFVEEFGEPAEAFPLETSEPVSILTAEEEQNLQDEAMSAAKLCMEFYREVDNEQSSED